MLLCVSIKYILCYDRKVFYIESSFKHILHQALLVFSASALLVEGPATDDLKIVPKPKRSI